jgi:hypothetical protein
MVTVGRILAITGTSQRLVAARGYDSLARVLDEALAQAQHGKGAERHAVPGEPFVDQQIVRICEWLGHGGVAFAVGQAVKKAIESSRLPDERARAELLGAINYLAAAVLVIDRRQGDRPCPAS